MQNKTNQDDFILAPNIQDEAALHLFAVCDGYGKEGDEASAFMKFALPTDLEDRLVEGSYDHKTLA